MADPYRELFERSADAILFIEGETFVDCNAAAVEMLRCRDRAEVLSTHPSELSPEIQPDGRPSFEKASEMIAIAFERGSHRFEWDHLRADGEVFPVEVLLTAVGERLHVVWRDITARKRLESKLGAAQKMEVVGRLAAGVAHDFNNLLVVVLGNADLLAQSLVPGSVEHTLATEIRQSGERGSRLVKRLLALSRKHYFLPSAVELGGLVEDLGGLLRRLVGEDVEVELERGDEPATIVGDRGQLEQAVLNLAINACDAMANGGRLKISTGLRGREDDDPPGSTEARYVYLCVTDDGSGMDATTVVRACEPFFTTKGGSGTGLGLSSVQGTVSQSGGFIRIQSELGRGTRVGLYWLRGGVAPIESRVPANEAETKDEGRWLQSLADIRLLLVEDEDPVAAFVERTLHESGCQVVRAAHGEVALDLLERDADFDLILSDVVMPVMGGPAFVAELRRRGLGIPAVFMSGYSDEANTAAGLDADGPLLEKPFSPWELRRVIRTHASKRGPGSGPPGDRRG